MLPQDAQTSADCWYSYIQSTVQLALALTAIILIVHLFLRKKSEGHTATAQCPYHIYYISGFAVFLLIELITYLCMEGTADKQKIVDLLTFGSTLTSIILSIVAIFYTLISGKGAREQLGKIEQANEQLTRTAEKIEEFKRSIQDLTQFKDKLVTLETNLDRLSQEITVKLEELRAGQIKTQKDISDFKKDTQSLSIEQNETGKYGSTGLGQGAEQETAIPIPPESEPATSISPETLPDIDSNA